MQVQMRFFANFRAIVGEKEISREFEGDVVAGDVLRGITDEFPEIELFEADGSLRPHLTVLYNGQSIVHMDGLETVIEDGDEVSVFPPIAGG